MVAAGIRRGLVAGLLAGLLAGVFALLVGYQPMARAIQLEEAGEADHDHGPAAQQDDRDDASTTDRDGSDGEAHEHEDAQGRAPAHAHDDGAAAGGGHEHRYARSTQQAMVPLATVVIGLGLGGLFGLIYALWRSRRPEGSDWRASLRLGAVAWAVTVLAPTLTVPANPPGVGDAASLDGRTTGYLLAIGAAAVAAGGLAGLARALARRGLRAPVRQTLVGVAALVAGGLLVALLPVSLPGDGFPAELLWRFRLISVGAQTLLWAGIAAGVGLLWERAAAGGGLLRAHDGAGVAAGRGPVAT